ncbi:MAG: hypothetical protein KJ667_06925, partial [Alphaproteobacteria bacterium]|nr:hypothetical protein [Alphaproteobacteria bacterium]
MSLFKKFAIAATMIAPLLVAGCGTPVTALCPDTGPGIGQSSYSQIFNDSAGPQKICIVKASDLQAEGHYAMKDGSVIIEGNVPAGARISVNDGKLFVNGDVGDAARLSAKVPEDYSRYTVLVPMFTGKTTILMPQVRTRFDDYTHKDDTTPAVTISGDVAPHARLSSNHGIAIGGEQGADVRIDHTRDAGYATVQTGA